MDGAQLRELDREEIQALAKREGIKANEKSENIIEQLLLKYPDGVAPFEGTVPRKKAPKKRAGAKQRPPKKPAKRLRMYVGESVSQRRMLGTDEPSESNHSRDVKAESSASQDLPQPPLPTITEQQDEAGPSRRSPVPLQEESASARRAGLADRPHAANSPLPPSSPPSPPSQTPPPIPREPIPQAGLDPPQVSSPHDLPHIDDDDAPPANAHQAFDLQQDVPIPEPHPQGEAHDEDLIMTWFLIDQGDLTPLTDSLNYVHQRLDEIKKLNEVVRRENDRVLERLREVQHKRHKLERFFSTKFPEVFKRTQDVTEMTGESRAAGSSNWGGQGSSRQAQSSVPRAVRLEIDRLIEGEERRRLEDLKQKALGKQRRANARAPAGRKRAREEVEEEMEEAQGEVYQTRAKKARRAASYASWEGSGSVEI
ncbi:hypothetical protein NLI96_g5210 [Meripilus lineatus]|uniref:Uncharacterized protein n=1 Tax=Meripilus lineatus TaxID=2056292 RepID=A0AAD5YJC7_9APHY|nr:hypothetical protein NLI96_g5210 [Physisporinus lineatus]